MNATYSTRKRSWALSALFFLTVIVQAQTIVQVIVDQPKKLEIVANELFYHTDNTTVMGDKVSIVGGVSPYRYSWLLDGQVIGTTLIMEIPKTNHANEIVLVVKDTNNCSCTKNANPTGTDEIMEGIPSIAVYPNPASDFIIINPQGIQGMLEVSIFDSQGTFLLKKQINGTSFLDINLPAGLYFLKIVDKNKQIVGVKKLIVT